MIDCSGCFAPCCMVIDCSLLVDGRCLDYANRPDICNTDTMFDKHYSKVMTREVYDKLSDKACESLREIYRG